MLAALSPRFCSIGHWLLDDPMINSHEKENNFNNFMSREKIETSNSIDILDHSLINSGKIQPRNDDFHKGDDINNMVIKKLNHSACERNRRQKINTLFYTLKSLLPPQDQSKKLSIPATLSRMLKYIPELKKEVERLSKKKESLMSSKLPRVEEQYTLFRPNNERIKSIKSPISATPINDREIVIQSSMPKAEKRVSLSEAVIRLEQEGFVTMSATCFESFDGRVFYNLHLQAEGSQLLMDAEILKEKVWQF